MPIMGRVVRSLIALVAAETSLAQPTYQFTEVAAQHGIGPYVMAAGMGAGAAAADFDNDGDIDIFVPNAQGIPDQLYRNQNNGEFEEIATAAGLASLARGRCALWFDYDGDRRLDLAVAGDCFQSDCANLVALRLYRQVAPAQFVDVTAASGLVENVQFHSGRHRGGMAAGDISGDGRLDLIVTLWNGPVSLFLNNGDGTFSDISLSSGIGSVPNGHFQPLLYDFDGDGWLDIYQAVDFAENRLWINQRDNTFVDAAAGAGLDNVMNDMGMTLGDYDNDGDFDIYITNIFQNGNHNVLFRNDSIGASLSFAEVSQAAGVDNGHWGWGTTFLDADNDGRLDLAATNGIDRPKWINDPSRFFHNLGTSPVTFADVSAAVRFDDTYWGSGLVALDFDRDGDPDLLQTTGLGGPLRLLENRPTGGDPNNYLVIRPRMSGPNSHAIGATVRLEFGSLRLMRLITAGTSFMGQEPAEAFFGLGRAPSVDSVSIDWPDGARTVLSDVVCNQVLTVNAPHRFQVLQAGPGIQP